MKNGDGSRIFNINDDDFSTHDVVSISGLTLTGGDSTFFGGAISSNEDLTLTGLVVSQNANQLDGGGIWCAGNMTITDCAITHNTAGDGGGGIVAESNLTITGSEISYNTASGIGSGRALAGGIEFNSILGGNTLQITDSLITNNATAFGGGGIRITNYLPARNPTVVTISHSTVSGNTIDPHSPVSGGGIYAYRTNLVISDCVISNNQIHSSGFGNGGARGGGLFLFNGSLSMIGTIVSGNSISGSGATDGGGIYAGVNGIGSRNSPVTITNCAITNNSAGRDGGGIWSGLSNTTIANSDISHNTAGRRGGGINANGLTVTSSLIALNSTYGDSGSGGGIYIGGLNVGTATITHSSILQNSTSGNGSTGGGVYSKGQITLTNSTVSGNSTSGPGANGGGVFGLNRVVLATGTVTGNHVDDPSAKTGGVYMGSSLLDISNSIVAGNMAAGGQPDLRAIGNMNRRFSLIGSNSGTGLGEAPVGSPDSFGNLIGGPIHGAIDPKLGSLAYNGGPIFLDGSKMLTQMPLAGSPAINAGDPAAVAGGSGFGAVPASDGRGAPFTRIFGGRIDMGAIEVEPTGFLAGDYNGNGIVDAADYTLWQDTNGTSVTAASGADGNGDGKVDSLDYHVWMTNFGQVLPVIPGGGAASVVVRQEPLQSVLSKPVFSRTFADPSVVDVVAGRTPIRDASATIAARPTTNSFRDEALLTWLAERENSLTLALSQGERGHNEAREGSEHSRRNVGSGDSAADDCVDETFAGLAAWSPR
jgi:hypothetical protein